MYVQTIAEIGINHNGNVNEALLLIELAAEAGFDFVKFQKRNPERYPEREYNSPLFGLTTYREHKKRLELNRADYEEIDRFCKDLEIGWTASPFDFESVDFLESFDSPFYKIASPSALNLDLVRYIAEKGRPVVVSTGMATVADIRACLSVLSLGLDRNQITILLCNSEYPTPLDHVNLSFIPRLKELFDRFAGHVGYSSHDGGVAIPVQAVAYGAEWIEVHVTRNRAAKGSDHAASLEPVGMRSFISHVKAVTAAHGEPKKQVYPGELAIKQKVAQAVFAEHLSGGALAAYLEVDARSEGRYNV